MLRWIVAISASGASILVLQEKIVKIHWRLAEVIVENRHYHGVIDRYDRPHTFFYLDPPYYAIKGYRFNFEAKDFEELAAGLAGVKGKLLMSLNDHREVRRIFKGFRIAPVALRYSCMRTPGGRGRTRSELLIRNY